MNEYWKDIPGYEGRYQASNLGRIKSLKRTVFSRNWSTGKPFPRTVAECILKPGRYCRSGHLSVILGRGSFGKPVHQLVLLTFCGKPPIKNEVLHINGDPTDNRVEYFRYGTRTENILDVYRQGKCWRKLSIEDVDWIRFALFCGIRGSDIAKAKGVSQTTISSIKKGHTFSWLR